MTLVDGVDSSLEICQCLSWSEDYTKVWHGEFPTIDPAKTRKDCAKSAEHYSPGGQATIGRRIGVNICGGRGCLFRVAVLVLAAAGARRTR